MSTRPAEDELAPIRERSGAGRRSSSATHSASHLHRFTGFPTARARLLEVEGRIRSGRSACEIRDNLDGTTEIAPIGSGTGRPVSVQPAYNSAGRRVRHARGSERRLVRCERPWIGRARPGSSPSSSRPGRSTLNSMRRPIRVAPDGPIVQGGGRAQCAYTGSARAALIRRA